MTGEQAIEIINAVKEEAKRKCPIDYEISFEIASEIAIKAIEKQIPKSIVGNEYNPLYIGDTVNGMCPECMTDFVCITPMMYKARGFGYCKCCGQKMDWSEK